MSHPDSTPQPSSIKAVIFDLDGVLVDTARYHDQAWEELATGFGYALTEADRHALKGRSRADSLEYILEQAGWEDADPAQKSRWLQAKNARYLELVEGLTPHDAAEGALDLLVQLREVIQPQFQRQLIFIARRIAREVQPTQPLSTLQLLLLINVTVLLCILLELTLEI
jgi:beta-phosphoglucomutase-like phosphatase (HAD superfamily)